MHDIPGLFSGHQAPEVQKCIRAMQDNHIKKPDKKIDDEKDNQVQGFSLCQDKSGDIDFRTNEPCEEDEIEDENRGLWKTVWLGQISGNWVMTQLIDLSPYKWKAPIKENNYGTFTVDKTKLLSDNQEVEGEDYEAPMSHLPSMIEDMSGNGNHLKLNKGDQSSEIDNGSDSSFKHEWRMIHGCELRKLKLERLLYKATISWSCWSKRFFEMDKGWNSKASEIKIASDNCKKRGDLRRKIQDLLDEL